ncbi:MAG: HpcH/HpaI aldolase family protein, partial [Acidimicrobiales bacterium]
LKTAWSNDEPTLGLWLANADPVAVEQLGGVGYDYTCLDLQHGLIDYGDVIPALQAQQRSQSIPIARAPWNEPGIIGKLLDAGVMGVIIPMVNTVAEAEQAVAACRYAPMGSRSYGPSRAAPALGGQYFEEANQTIACIPMIETTTALENLDDIVKVEGIDALYVGPADLAISLGLGPGSDKPDQSFQDALTHVVSACNANGLAPGIHTIPDLVQTRLGQGFKMVTVTSDLGAVGAGARNALAVARGEASGSGGSMY